MHWLVSIFVCFSSISGETMTACAQEKSVPASRPALVRASVYGTRPPSEHPSLHTWVHTVRWNPLLVGVRRLYVYEHIGRYSGSLYLFEPLHKPHHLMPLVVYFHGGSLMHGSAVIGPGPRFGKEWMIADAERQLVQHGFAFATVDYRLAPTYRWPAQIEDAKTAVRFLALHARELSINPAQISVMGDSAGGALASLVGLTDSGGAYQQVFVHGPWQGVEASVRAVVDLFGPVDRRWTATKWSRRFGNRPNPVFGVLRPNLVRSASAVSYVHTGAPPFLIVQGLQDPVDPPWLSLELYHKLKAVGAHPKLVLVHHASHELIPKGGHMHPTVAQVLHTVFLFLNHYGRQQGAPRHTL
ncbi:MAG: alpha/beta hydrolase [Alicyclobacillus sp.]|nr:alpha/beta hydrolase [Alicyclobacillus sp.]